MYFRMTIKLLYRIRPTVSNLRYLPSQFYRLRLMVHFKMKLMNQNLVLRVFRKMVMVW